MPKSSLRVASVIAGALVVYFLDPRHGHGRREGLMRALARLMGAREVPARPAPSLPRNAPTPPPSPLGTAARASSRGNGHASH